MERKRHVYASLPDMPEVRHFPGWPRQPERQRTFVLRLGWLTIIIIGAGTLGWAIPVWIISPPPVTVSDIFAAGTLLLGLIAGVVALLAYAVSTGLPDLELGFMFRDQDPYKREQIYVKNAEWWKRVAYIWVDNKSNYAARNAAVIVQLRPETGLYKTFSNPVNKKEPWKDKGEDQPWKDIEFETSGNVVLAMQWDGGPINGRSTRRLPDLPLVDLFRIKDKQRIEDDGEAKINIVLLAEGYRREVPVTIKLTTQCKRKRKWRLTRWRCYT